MTETTQVRAENPITDKSKSIDTIGNLLKDSNHNDALSYFLDQVKMKGAIATRVEFNNNEAIEIDECYYAFHYVIEGCLYFFYDRNSNFHKLESGDLIITTKRLKHLISAQQKFSNITNFNNNDDFENINNTVEKSQTKTLSGIIDFDKTLANLVFSPLPEFILITRKSDSERKWLDTSILFLELELCASEPGYRNMISRLIEIIFIRALREYIYNANLPPSIFLAIKDKRIIKSILEMKINVQKKWTVAELAALSAMSLSSYFERFKKLVGQSPLDFLLNCRIEKAVELLLQNEMTITQIANNVGYESDAAFSRAFKRVLNCTPTQWRQNRN